MVARVGAHIRGLKTRNQFLHSFEGWSVELNNSYVSPTLAFLDDELQFVSLASVRVKKNGSRSEKGALETGSWTKIAGFTFRQITKSIRERCLCHMLPHSLDTVVKPFTFNRFISVFIHC